MGLNQLHDLLAENEHWLTERVIGYAQAQGFVKYTSSLMQPWKMSVRGLTATIRTALNDTHVLRNGLTPDDDYRDDPISTFAVSQAQAHRERGITLTMYLGLLKYYRKAYFDLVGEKSQTHEKDTRNEFLLDFFDRMEVALCGDWATVCTPQTGDTERIRLLANEKNRLLTLVESLAAPVFLFNMDKSLQYYNVAAATLLGLACDPGSSYYCDDLKEDQCSGGACEALEKHLPWLEEMVIRATQTDTLESNVEKEATIHGTRRHFRVSMTRMSDISGKFEGIVTTLEDISRLVISEEKARVLFQAAADPQFVVGMDGRFLDINEAACKSLGYSRTMLMNMGFQDIYPPEDIEQAENHLKKAFENGSVYFEAEHADASGELQPVEVNSRTITYDGEQAMLSTVRHIGERKRAEEALKKSEEKFRRIFETMEDGYFLTTLDGSVLMVNPSAARQLGYDNAQDLLGRNVRKELYQSPEDRDKMLEHLHREGSLRNHLVTFKKRDETEITAEMNIHFVLNDQGDAVALEGIFRDATERIQAEEVLREREQQYRGFFMNNHAVMLLSDPRTGDIVDANPAAERFYGFDRSELMEKNMGDLEAMTRDELFNEMALAQKERRKHFILRHKVFGGEERDVEVYSGPVIVNHRALLYSVIHDVTARRKLESEMHRMATTDSLTGICNRREFMIRTEQEFARSRRYNHDLTMLMLDLDHFKEVNDSHGHKAGDDVLRQVAKIFESSLRETDTIGRLGGEEFAIALIETGQWDAEKAAERIRKKLAYTPLETSAGNIRITVSIGIATQDPLDESMDDLLQRADKALYEAKNKGRNRVERS